jgi:hypothetical protein
MAKPYVKTPSYRTYTGDKDAVILRGGQAIFNRSNAVKVQPARGPARYVGHKPAQSKYLPRTCVHTPKAWRKAAKENC